MFTEKPPITSPLLEQFEKELDDLLEADEILKTLPDENDDRIRKKESYLKKTTKFEKILDSTKNAYVDCLSSDFPGYEHFVTIYKCPVMST